MLKNNKTHFFIHLIIIFLMIYIQEEVKVVLDVGRLIGQKLKPFFCQDL